MSIESLLDGLISKKSDDKRKVVKRIPMKKEWIAIRDELMAGKSEIEDILLKTSHLKRKLWFTIEEDTGLYADMRINEKTGEIEVLEKQSVAADEDDE